MKMNEKLEDKIFKAIADSKRRQILKLIVFASVTLNINSISANFAESRQAITKHINVLEEAGLVITVKKGRETFCTADPKGLMIVHQWVNLYKEFWNIKLDSLDNFLKQS